MVSRNMLFLHSTSVIVASQKLVENVRLARHVVEIVILTVPVHEDIILVLFSSLLLERLLFLHLQNWQLSTLLELLDHSLSQRPAYYSMIVVLLLSP